MRKVLLAATISILFIQQADAQKGRIYASIDLGYGFPSGEGTWLSGTESSRSASFYSFGAGLNIAASGSYFFSDHIGAGLDIGYLFGSPLNSTNQINNNNGNAVIGNFVNTGSLFAITPNLVLSLNHEKINPYARFGIVLGAASVVEKATEEGPGEIPGTNIELLTGDLSLGFYGAFGIRFALSDKLSLEAELFDRTMTFEPTQAVNTQTFDGLQKSPTITFSKNIDNTSSSNTQLLFSSLGHPD